MKPIPPPDCYHLSSAEGWLMLGNPVQALGELQKVDPSYTSLPNYLEFKWRVFADTQDWDAALELAEVMVKDLPSHPGGFILRSYSLRRSKNGSVEMATSALLEAAAKFPQEPIIPYNLACYACQSGNLNEARKFLRLALELGERKELLKMAKLDSDLKPLWSELGNL
ncbi:MAG: tetratricopeptide repeat protein [Verrucomicrobiota bacterium]|nr:tetratricopeptide repeat protein [Verrucomicrobiota bacterium]